jgi:hypothetical protein
MSRALFFFQKNSLKNQHTNYGKWKWPPPVVPTAWKWPSGGIYKQGWYFGGNELYVVAFIWGLVGQVN